MSAELPALLGGPPVRPEGPPVWPPADPALTEGVRAALADGSWGRYHGDWCRQLQALLQESHQVEQVLLTCSGTAAVELALRGLGVGPGDEVILSAYDFKGNCQDILSLGAVPVLVDVRPDDWALDVAQVPAAISSKTKAILASHLHGATVDMRALTAIARERGIGVLEDACQAPGAIVQGQPAGTWGDVGTLSFGGSKLVTAGRGGAVLSNRADIVQKIRLHVLRGNDAYPLSELQAAALIPQWRRLAESNRQRSAAVNWLKGALKDSWGMLGLRPFATDGESTQPAYYKWGLQYAPSAGHGLTRGEFARAVRAEGIALDPGLRGLHKIHSSRRFRAVGDLAEATRADDGVLTLHHPVLLGTAQDLVQIPAALNRIGEHAQRLVEWFATPGRLVEPAGNPDV